MGRWVGCIFRRQLRRDKQIKGTHYGITAGLTRSPEKQNGKKNRQKPRRHLYAIWQWTPLSAPKRVISTRTHPDNWMGRPGVRGHLIRFVLFLRNLQCDLSTKKTKKKRRIKTAGWGRPRPRGDYASGMPITSALGVFACCAEPQIRRTSHGNGNAYCYWPRAMGCKKKKKIFFTRGGTATAADCLVDLA